MNDLHAFRFLQVDGNAALVALVRLEVGVAPGGETPVDAGGRKHGSSRIAIQ